ncbi:MAG: hypothetical protein NTX13_02475 [Acidobacteria bacterium]|nr:hypothetical protein [Acidobacteriota bacterium]
MARLGPLLGGLVKIRWRTLTGRSSAEITGEVLLLLAAALLAERVVAYLPQLPLPGVVAGLAVAWLALSWGPEGAPGQFPLKRGDRMLVRLTEVAVNPLSWVLFYVSARVSPWAPLLAVLAMFEWPVVKRGKRLSAGPSRCPALLRKDVRAAVRLFDTMIAGGIALMFVAYAVRARNMAVEAAWIVPVVLAISNSNLALNAFGTDQGTGFDRYLLLPMTGADIVRSKTTSLLVLLGAPMGLVSLAVFWRLGWAMGASVVVESVTVLLLLAGWGAWTSVRAPYPMRAYRFSDGGSVLAGLVTFALCLLAGLAAARGEWWVRFAILGGAGLFARQLMAAAGRRLEHRRELIRARLP